MHVLERIILAPIGNILGLVAAAYFLSDFRVTGGITQFIVLGLILTFLNLTLKPLLKLVLSPFIVLTLGLGLVAVNALILYVLDILFGTLSIASIGALAYAAIIVSAVNIVLHLIIGL